MLWMKHCSPRMMITNDGSDPLVVFVEPWGRDFTLLVGESFDLVLEGGSPESHFNTFCSPNRITVYAEGAVEDVLVYQGGTRVECGHNRQ